ncbi:hypothetical protein TNCV_2933331 [Trichonephila clavipes]|nr:hypothetical protein TNCV_2933331 [Trichonephila clavipes]
MESDEAFLFQCWALIFAPATQISLANGTRALTVHGWATVKLFIAVALLPISTVAPVEIITLDPPSAYPILVGITSESQAKRIMIIHVINSVLTNYRVH